jgi:DNA-binding beta-propeller fold protein YncE
MKHAPKYLAFTLVLIFASDPLLAQDSHIYWVDHQREMLVRTNGEGENREILKMGAGYARQASVDVAQNRIFWSSYHSYSSQIFEHTIRVAALDGSHFDHVAEVNGMIVGGVHYDETDDQVWWTEKSARAIRRVDLATGVTADILDSDDGVVAPTGITVHNGFIYWGDDSSESIYRARTDGTGIEEIVPAAGLVKGLALDATNGHLYWANFSNIVRADLDGTNVINILSASPLQVALDIDDQKIYYTNFTGMGGDLVVYDIATQAKTVLIPISRNFANPFGLTLAPGDGVYHVRERAIEKYDFEQEANVTVVARFEPVGISVDYQREIVFWTDRHTGGVYRANMDLSDAREVIIDFQQNFGLVGPVHDSSNSRLVYAMNSRLYTNSYDGTEHEQIYLAASSIRGIALDPAQETIYFFDNTAGPAHLKRILYDGSGLDTLLEFGVWHPGDLVIDVAGKYLYWSRTRDTIERSRLDGTDRVVLYSTESGDPVDGLTGLSLDLVNGDLYYGSGSMVYRAAVDGSGTAIVYADLYTYVAGISTSIGQRTSSAAGEEEVPDGVALYRNYPNPFNPTTLIGYRIEVSGHVLLEVFDMTGRRVAVLVDGVQAAGQHEIAFDATSLPSGSYVYRLRTGNASLSGTMTLVK